MLAYIARRLLATLPVMAMVAVVVFAILRLTPGDPAAIIAGDSATAEQLQLACVFATERFWSNLRDFAVLNHHRPPKRWVSQLSASPAHPFFEVQQLPEQQQQQQQQLQHEEGGQRDWRLYAKARPPPFIVLPDVL